jgi:mono/diheme cytochrome c family protein
MRHIWTFAMAIAALLGCTPEGKPPAAAAQAPAVERIGDRAVLARGSELYQQHCASCHGTSAQGAPNWQKSGPDGKYPPPPLDGSAHAWHHPMVALKQTIQEGTQRLGGAMPAWKGKLSEADTDALIAWFQSTWPDEIYATWADMDRRARRGEAGH